MKKFNLLNHKRKAGMTFDEFKTWLNQLIVDKKGALPDLADWKKIKENIDRVRVPEDFSLTGVFPDKQFNCLDDIEYFQKKLFTSMAIPASMMYNGQQVNLLEAQKYDIHSKEENESTRNRSCSGK